MANYSFLKSHILLISLFCLIAGTGYGESGYDLWLRYKPIRDPTVLASYRSQLDSFAVESNSPTAMIIRAELQRAFSTMLWSESERPVPTSPGLYIAVKNPNDPRLASFDGNFYSGIGKEGYGIRTIRHNGRPVIIITANTDIGLLYGTFHLLRLMQQQSTLDPLDITESPKISLRLLDHWDNLDRTSERGYAGFSIWDWHRLPDYKDPRYTDYARANASLGINGTVLTNVNANALVLTPRYLEKVKALADLFRPYGIRVYLTARFNAPMELGDLKTADPLDPEVSGWWKKKADEIYSFIPDFGGFLVKANSEGQPGPQHYGRNHADGANMLADALAPHNGVVMWRAFVYSDDVPEDRAKQAYNEFKPLDGKFRENVLLQVKNGPIDFQPREPFHPLFGAMPGTPLMMELQITQEYLGQATQWVYLAPMYKECLQSDTYAAGKGSLVSRVIDGSLDHHAISGIAGVANIGTDINWTGHPMAQANYYCFGRLAWDPDLSAENIAVEWIRQTFGNDPEVVEVISKIMMNTWESAVHYMTPLGLHHLMGAGHHYGPGPWVKDMPREDWTAVYYHKADKNGIGFDRTSTGSDAVAQYFPEVEKKFSSLDSCPEKFLLWFHHIPWEYHTRSGKTLWTELALTYQSGVDDVRSYIQRWNTLEHSIDKTRFQEVKMLLGIQLKEAVWWKNASLLYFQTFSGQPIPDGVEKPDHTLEYYESLTFPYAPGIRPRW